MNPREPDDDFREIVRAEVPGALEGPEALARLIEQSNREATASRAQARELIKALEGVQRSQEYLGTALREERAKSRWLFALVVVAPLAVAGVACYVVGRMNEVRAGLDQRITEVVADAAAARAEDASKFHDARVAELSSGLESLRRDLDSSRDALDSERKHLSEREAALAAAESRSEGARGEIGALQYEVSAARSKASAEQARAIQLENRIRELQSEIDERAKAQQPAPAPAPAATNTPAAPPAAVANTKSDAPSVPEVKPAPADAAAVEKTRTALNALLGESSDTVRYQFAVLGGVPGRSLTGVKLVGFDTDGTVVRTILADRAEIDLDPSTASVVIRCFGGKLVVGGTEAPFFDGKYGLVVAGDPKKWKAAALECVRAP